MCWLVQPGNEQYMRVHCTWYFEKGRFAKVCKACITATFHCMDRLNGMRLPVDQNPSVTTWAANQPGWQPLQMYQLTPGTPGETLSPHSTGRTRCNAQPPTCRERINMRVKTSPACDATRLQLCFLWITLMNNMFHLLWGLIATYNRDFQC